MSLDKFLKQVDGVENSISSDKVLMMDGHNLMFRTLFVANKQEPLDMDFTYWKYLMLNSIFRTIQFHKPSKFILAFDGKDYWRKDVYPEYKAKRKSARDKSAVDFDKFFPISNKFMEDIQTIFNNWYVLRMDKIEADDIIAVGVTDIFRSSKEIVNISTDKDFYQLMKHDNYKQYDPIKRVYVESINPLEDLQIKLLTGDISDNIPGVKKKCGPVTAKKLLDAGLDISLNEEMRVNYELNKQLIDMDCIPVNIVNKITKDIQNYDIGEFNGKGVFKFLIDQGLSGFADDMQNYLGVLKRLG